MRVIAVVEQDVESGLAPRFYLDNRDDSEYGIWGERKADKAPRTKAWAKGIVC